MSTSANISGEEPAKTAQEAAEKLGDKVNMILDGGPSPGEQPSTVLEMSGEELWLLRKGPITGEQIMGELRA